MWTVDNAGLSLCKCTAEVADATTSLYVNAHAIYAPTQSINQSVDWIVKTNAVRLNYYSINTLRYTVFETHSVYKSDCIYRTDLQTTRMPKLSLSVILLCIMLDAINLKWPVLHWVLGSGAGTGFSNVCGGMFFFFNKADDLVSLRILFWSFFSVFSLHLIPTLPPA